jgi:hypothetical protein
LSAADDGILVEDEDVGGLSTGSLGKSRLYLREKESNTFLS